MATEVTNTTTSKYSTIGVFGSDASKSLSGDIIEKLKAVDEKAKIEPIDKDLETWDKELEKIDEIKSSFSDLMSTSNAFDLYSPKTNVFNQVSAAAGGSGAALFDAADITQLDEGTTTVHVDQLAQKDVFQTDKFSDPTADIDGGQDDGDKITINGVDFSTEDKSYEDLAKDINANENFTASVEQVGDNDYRIVIKSANTGVDNALIISETGVDLKLANDTDGDGDVDDDDNTDNADNHVLTAQNFKATIDGVDYDVSTDSIKLANGLTITANKVDGDGESSTLSIKKDTSGIIPAIDDIVEKYNAVVDLIDEELYSADSSIKDLGTFRTIESDLKNMFFGQYGDDDLSAFNYGFSFDKKGHLSYDKEILGKAITDNPDDIKTLFTGVSEDKGIGTKMKEYFVNLDLRDGLMYQYSDAMADRKIKLEDEKEKAQKTIDDKYDAMATQFVAYGALISQMESSFAGLKMIIEHPPKD